VIINANAEKIRAEKDKKGREMRKIGGKRGREKKMAGKKKVLELFISEKIEKFIYSLTFNVYYASNADKNREEKGKKGEGELKKMRGIWRKRDKMRGKIARKGDKRAKGKSASGKQALSCLVVVGILMSAVSISILVAAAEVDIAQCRFQF